MRKTPSPTSRDPLEGFERWLDRRLPEPRGLLATVLVFPFESERGFIEARQRDWGEVCP